jgi:hypothetical protein
MLEYIPFFDLVIQLPEEYEKCLVGINMIKKEAWTLAQNTKDKYEDKPLLINVDTKTKFFSSKSLL